MVRSSIPNYGSDLKNCVQTQIWAETHIFYQILLQFVWNLVQKVGGFLLNSNLNIIKIPKVLSNTLTIVDMEDISAEGGQEFNPDHIRLTEKHVIFRQKMS